MWFGVVGGIGFDRECSVRMSRRSGIGFSWLWRGICWSIGGWSVLVSLKRSLLDRLSRVVGLTLMGVVYCGELVCEGSCTELRVVDISCTVTWSPTSKHSQPSQTRRRMTARGMWMLIRRKRQSAKDGFRIPHFADPIALMLFATTKQQDQRG